MVTDSDNHTIKELKEGTQELIVSLCKLLQDYEEKFDLRTGINIERDPETNNVIDATIALVDEKMYV
jgi:hypothetical protein